MSQHVFQMPRVTPRRVAVAPLQASYPGTKIVVVKLLPRLGLDMGPANLKYRSIASRRGLTWSTCGQFLNASGACRRRSGAARRLHNPGSAAGTMLRCHAPSCTAIPTPTPHTHHPTTTTPAPRPAPSPHQTRLCCTTAPTPPHRLETSCCAAWRRWCARWRARRRRARRRPCGPLRRRRRLPARPHLGRRRASWPA